MRACSTDEVPFASLGDRCGCISCAIAFEGPPTRPIDQRENGADYADDQENYSDDLNVQACDLSIDSPKQDHPRRRQYERHRTPITCLLRLSASGHASASRSVSNLFLSAGWFRCLNPLLAAGQAGGSKFRRRRCSQMALHSEGGVAALLPRCSSLTGRTFFGWAGWSCRICRGR